MIIGSNVIIEEECIVKCLSIGSNVCIGKGSILVRFYPPAFSDLLLGMLLTNPMQSDKCIIYDNSYILPGSVLPAGTVVAPFTVYGGSPAAPASQLTESFTELQQALARTYYSRYKQTDGVSLQSSSK
jgi:carbonic anhydrase/acetyltransferase-like protein (isoleucine patch superfamily)